VMDVKWKDHLHAMDQLRSGIGLRAYAQKDPQVAYKVEGYDLFQSMIESIKDEVSSLVLRLQPAEEGYEAEDVWRVSDTTHSEVRAFDAAGMAAAAETPQATEVPKPFIRHDKKVGRNDPCPCGSGKKYKKCCGAS
ncbi:MAG TPA: SEC-C metal-binding domain-containing protein, partial [Planctomycetota bacterium]|nr:SEC-C metal-binding domain-containing protein [Planctomycetota bacterium]